MTLGDRFTPIMDAARWGDERALAALYADVNPILLRYLRAREPREADDLASETWIVLARRIPTFQGDERQWLGLVFLVCRRCLNDHWKRTRRRRTDPMPADAFSAHAATDDVEAAGLRAITDRDALALVASCLTAEQADVVLLRIVAGLDVDEVATAIGKRPGTVRVIQHRALRRLAEHITAAGAAAGVAADVVYSQPPNTAPPATPDRAVPTIEGLS